MKSGWHMEWDNEVAFKAPMRAHVNSMTKAFRGVVPAIQKIGISMQEAMRKMAEVIRAMDQTGKQKGGTLAAHDPADAEDSHQRREDQVAGRSAG